MWGFEIFTLSKCSNDPWGSQYLLTSEHGTQNSVAKLAHMKSTATVHSLFATML